MDGFGRQSLKTHAACGHCICFLSRAKVTYPVNGLRENEQSYLVPYGILSAMSVINQLIDHFQLTPLPVEGTLYAQTYRSALELAPGQPAGTGIVGMYCHTPLSLSIFHRVSHDEVWHSYRGDPFVLYLLHHDGTLQEVTMGHDFTNGQRVQFTVPAGVWQAGCLVDHGTYALFGCTMAPGFNARGFEGGTKEKLLPLFPQHKALIEKLASPDIAMPEHFDG